MQVSAFVDGELPENEAELLVRRLSQDALLRKQVAEYLAIGRVMRGEYSVKGTDVLRERVAAELDAGSPQDLVDEPVVPARSRFGRPLAGLGIAAAVALVAILGLQQIVNVELGAPDGAVASVEGDATTVPTMSQDDMLYLMLHSETSNSFDARWTAAQIRAEELGEEEEGTTGEEASPETESVTNQP
jgi:sigma-E factor negative regulatory protein RseA